MRKIFYTFTLFLFSFSMAKAQNYQPELAFKQDFYTVGGNQFRSANGAPGKHYWQNKVDYDLEASFDTLNHVLSGMALIHYQNNSPDSLDFLWLALSQNTDKKDALGQMMKNPVSKQDTNRGFKIQSVEIKEGNRWQETDYLINDTRMQIQLKQPLSCDGGRLDIRINYQFKLLHKSAAGRAGFMKTPQGTIFEIGYWYPRMCVYDDLRGWNTLPFIGGGEFYCEYGDFDYKITVPSGILVVGAGQLVNGQEILSEKILENIKKARQSDKTIVIRSADDVIHLCPTKKQTGETTWHFKMKNTRDVAFACSRSFIWDGAKATVQNGKTVFVQSVYPESSNKAKDGWQKATELLKASVEIFSQDWFIYPYPEAVSVAGRVGGMEFPAITFDWHDAKGKTLWMLISHEIGHSWFPMVVGSNERRYPFMDEGMNVFIDIYAQEEYNNGEFAPKRDGEYAPKGGNPADEIVPVIRELQGSYSLLDAPDRMDYKIVHPLFYFKTAFGLVLLREVILGKDRFDYAFRTYIKRWAYKHPSPIDFFRTMNNASGEDLTWFWRGWFNHNWLLDQAVDSVEYTDDDPKKGALITIVNKEKLVMPVIVLIEQSNGKEQRLKLPVDIWSHGAKWTFHAPTTSLLKSITLDPDHQLPDMNRENNVWVSKSKIK